MELVNLKDSQDTASFAEAVKRGLGKQQGLYFPTNIPTLDDIDGLLEMPFVERSIKVLRALIGDELNNGELEEIVTQAFAFGAPVAQVTDNVYTLELFFRHFLINVYSTYHDLLSITPSTLCNFITLSRTGI